jgi:hypothetical protein
MATGYHDDSNNPRYNFVPHVAGSDAERGIPAVGKIVYRTDSGDIEVCTATSPDPTLNGGGTWTAIGGLGCPNCLESGPGADKSININAGPGSSGDVNLDASNDFNQSAVRDQNIYAGRDINIAGDAEVNVEGTTVTNIRAATNAHVYVGPVSSGTGELRLQPRQLSASSLGSLTGVFPVFAPGGTTVVGYVPVYDSYS